jgi:iron(III) transport system substrate-binding protein
MKRMVHRLAVLAGAAALVVAQPASAQLNMICSMLAEACLGVVNAFEKQTGVKVSLTYKSSGEAFAQVNAEKENPKTDVWFTGTGDPHLQAADQDLTLPYKSPMLDQLYPWAQAQAKISDYKTVGYYAGALGFGYNPEVMAKKKLPLPKCWADLLKPEYKDEIQIANPNTSGTAYTTLATLVQMWGEDKAFDYLKQLHRNVNQYTRSGAAPIKAAARGETAIGIVFLHDVVSEKSSGFNVVPVSPCEGTGYEIGSMSIVKGARNLENAKKFYDWALTPDAQKILAANKSFQLPSNKATPQPPESPRFNEIKLIDYDLKKYGSAAERKRLLARWDKEVYGMPK